MALTEPFALFLGLSLVSLQTRAQRLFSGPPMNNSIRAHGFQGEESCPRPRASRCMCDPEQGHTWPSGEGCQGTGYSLPPTPSPWTSKKPESKTGT